MKWLPDANDLVTPENVSSLKPLPPQQQQQQGQGQGQRQQSQQKASPYPSSSEIINEEEQEMFEESQLLNFLQQSTASFMDTHKSSDIDHHRRGNLGDGDGDEDLDDGQADAFDLLTAGIPQPAGVVGGGGGGADNNSPATPPPNSLEEMLMRLLGRAMRGGRQAGRGGAADNDDDDDEDDEQEETPEAAQQRGILNQLLNNGGLFGRGNNNNNNNNNNNGPSVPPTPSTVSSGPSTTNINTQPAIAPWPLHGIDPVNPFIDELSVQEYKSLAPFKATTSSASSILQRFPSLTSSITGHTPIYAGDGKLLSYQYPDFSHFNIPLDCLQLLQSKFTFVELPSLYIDLYHMVSVVVVHCP